MIVFGDLKRSCTTGIGRGIAVWVPVMLGYMVLVLSIGFSFGIFRFQVIDLGKWWFLPLSLIVFPSLLEELVFRGVLLRRDLADWGWGPALWKVFCGSAAFTLWHPINALTINPTARSFFLDPVFLVIVFLLGIATGVGYLASRSLWVPVLMHWLTVVVWVCCLGGRNLVMEK